MAADLARVLRIRHGGWEWAHRWAREQARQWAHVFFCFLIYFHIQTFDRLWKKMINGGGVAEVVVVPASV